MPWGMGVSHNWWFLWHGEEREEWLLQSHFCPALSQEDGLDWELQCIPPVLSNQDPFGVGFHLLQSFGDRCRERECLTCVSVCTWLSKAGDGSLAMAQLVPGAAPSQRVEPARAPEEHLTNAAWNLCHQDSNGVWRAVCAWGSQAAALPSLLTQAAENVLRRFHCCVCCP